MLLRYQKIPHLHKEMNLYVLSTLDPY
jgi:hypothetical protein